MIGVISIFLLPYEFEELALTLNSLKRNSTFIDNSLSIKVEITLCLSDEMTDWSQSKLSKDYIENRVVELCHIYLDWCVFNLYIELSNVILGCVSHRRKSWKENQDADFFIWLDPDIFFKDVTLASISNAYNFLNQSICNEFIITPQIVKQWDNTWDVLVNKNYLQQCINYQAECNIFSDSMCAVSNVNILNSSAFKFAGGWFTLVTKQLLDRMGLPESLGHYGFDDDFLMYSCALMRAKGYKVNQFILENLIVGEVNKYKTTATIKEYLKSKNRKEEFRKIAESNFEKELIAFNNRLLVTPD